MKKNKEYPENKEQYYKCACGTEILNIVEEYELYGDEKTHYLREFYLSIFRGYDEKYSIWQRLKYIFRVLITGKVHYDQFILTEENAEKMTEWFKKRNEIFTECLIINKKDIICNCESHERLGYLDTEHLHCKARRIRELEAVLKRLR